VDEAAVRRLTPIIGEAVEMVKWKVWPKENGRSLIVAAPFCRASDLRAASFAIQTFHFRQYMVYSEVDDISC
jgi:hypothetical protein